EEDERKDSEKHYLRKFGEFKAKSREQWSSERKMNTCRVEAKWETNEEALRVTFDDGRQVTCGLDHYWLGRSRTKGSIRWKKARDFKIGDHVRWITKPWGESSFEDG